MLAERAFIPASGEKEFSSIGVSLLPGGRGSGKEEEEEGGIAGEPLMHRGQNLKNVI